MHDRHLSGLKALQEELARQKPALAAEIGGQLRNMSQALQASIQETSFSLVAYSARRRSEDLPSGPDGLPLHSDMDRPRSQSIGGTTVFEEDVATSKEVSAVLQDASSAETQSMQPLDAEESTERLPGMESVLKQEPTASLQLSHRQKSQCKRACSCQCHHPSKLKTPDFLREITGQLLIGYAGVSNVTPPCNEHACARRQKTVFRIQYYFPVWSLIQRMLTLVSCSGGACGPDKLLRMSRVRPGLDEVFIQVQGGNIRRLQQLFIQGDASPLDASDTGWTLLHYALTAGQLPTAKFLKDAGADVRAESTTRETPVDVAWNRILSGCLDKESEQLLRNVFDDEAQLDERQFTTLHKIVLGLLGKSLGDELEVSTAYINALDSSGNTPLAWASARGDNKSVALLLEHGASLDIANDVYAKPIHLAAQTGNIATVRTLVDAGAGINSAVRQTRMTPLHYAAEYQNSSSQIYGLVSLGARLGEKDYMSWTPLHWASWRGHLASLNALLDCGANVNVKTLDGNASTILAVASNSHVCVRRLIEAGADCSVVRNNQWNVLHYAAIGGSVETLRSLAEADLSGIDLQELKTKDTCQSVTDMLKARLEALEDNQAKREAWKLAWDALADVSEPTSFIPLLVRVRHTSTPMTNYLSKDQKDDQHSRLKYTFT